MEGVPVSLGRFDQDVLNTLMAVLSGEFPITGFDQGSEYGQRVTNEVSKRLQAIIMATQEVSE